MKLAHRTNQWLPTLIDEMFHNDFVGGRTMPASKVPAVNISETDTGFALEMVVPGFAKEDLKLEVDNDILTISSEVEKENSEKSEQFTRKEYVISSFSRSFNLPESVNQDKIDAEYNNGILSIQLPKKEEALPQPKRLISLK
jgi:HSP20 family protein